MNARSGTSIAAKENMKNTAVNGTIINPVAFQYGSRFAVAVHPCFVGLVCLWGPNSDHGVSVDASSRRCLREAGGIGCSM